MFAGASTATSSSTVEVVPSLRSTLKTFAFAVADRHLHLFLKCSRGENGNE